MMLFFLQSGPSFDPSAGPGVPMVWMLVLVIPVLMVLLGTVLGFRALTEIRLAEGRLGGALRATFAAGLLPAAVVIFACSGGLTLLAEEIAPHARKREDLWVTLGVLAGLGISFLMMRGMYRQATGGVRPRAAEAQPQSRQGLANAALILTIIGGLLIFTHFSSPDHREVLGSLKPPQMLLLNLLVLTAGLTCGIIARPGRMGTVCAWICGSLMLFLVLAHT